MSGYLLLAQRVLGKKSSSVQLWSTCFWSSDQCFLRFKRNFASVEFYKMLLSYNELFNRLNDAPRGKKYFWINKSTPSSCWMSTAVHKFRIRFSNQSQNFFFLHVKRIFWIIPFQTIRSFVLLSGQRFLQIQDKFTSKNLANKNYIVDSQFT